MCKIKDRIGTKLGALTVLKRGPNNKHGGTQWFCRCSCGDENCLEYVLVPSTSFSRGRTRVVVVELN